MRLLNRLLTDNWLHTKVGNEWCIRCNLQYCISFFQMVCDLLVGGYLGIGDRGPQIHSVRRKAAKGEGRMYRVDRECAKSVP